MFLATQTTGSDMKMLSSTLPTRSKRSALPVVLMAAVVLLIVADVLLMAADELLMAADVLLMAADVLLMVADVLLMAADVLLMAVDVLIAADVLLMAAESLPLCSALPVVEYGIAATREPVVMRSMKRAKFTMVLIPLDISKWLSFLEKSPLLYR